MKRSDLTRLISNKQSFLCIGLDPDPLKFPGQMKGDATATVDFCKEIIHATQQYCVAYKLNIAFFEALGKDGWDILHEVARALPANCFKIADAKRADIGNSAKQYARAFFETMPFDAITVAPYMGFDSVMPFLEYEGKWTILLALTSNAGSADFQMIRDSEGKPLYHHVLQTASSWGDADRLMFVIGATHPNRLQDVRLVVPDHFFLVPGVGAQGGDLDAVAKNAMTKDVGILVNATRSVIYASGKEDFAEAAAQEAARMQLAMAAHLPHDTD